MANASENAVFSTALSTRQYTQALNDLSYFIDIAPCGREGSGASLIGPAGSGKSTIVSALLKDHPPRSENGKTIRPILVAEVPSKPSIRSFYVALMEQLGGPVLARETNGSLRNRILRFIKETGVRVIVLEEFQHLARKVGVDSYGVCDTIKSLMNEGRIGILFVGVPEAETVVQMDDQILTRRVMAIRLYSFCDTQNPRFFGPGGQAARFDEFQEFKSVLHEFSTGFGCPDTAYVCDDAVASDLLDRSNGNWRVIRQLVHAAARDAKRRGERGIDMAAISEAYRLKAILDELQLAAIGQASPDRATADRRTRKAPRKISKEEKDLRNANGEFTTRRRLEAGPDRDPEINRSDEAA
jgi:hypothetical protein